MTPHRTAPTTAPPDATPALHPPAGGWGAGRRVAAGVAALVVLLALGAGAGGTAVLLLDGNRDSGFVMSGRETLETPTAAMVEKDLAVVVGSPAWLTGTRLDPASQLGTLRIDVTPRSEAPLFLGIADRDNAATYLAGTAHDEVTDWTRRPSLDRTPGELAARPPGELPWWEARASAAEPFTLTWEVTQGEWSVVLANADGSPGLAADVRAGATAPHLRSMGFGLLALAGGLLVMGSLGMAVTAAGAGRVRG